MTEVRTACEVVLDLHPLYRDGAITSVKRGYPSLMVTATQRDVHLLFDAFMELATVGYDEKLQCSGVKQTFDALTDIAREFCSKSSEALSQCNVHLSQDEVATFVVDFLNFIAIDQCVDYRMCPSDLRTQEA